MKAYTEEMAARSLELIYRSIDRYCEDIDKVMAQVEETHSEYELLHYGTYQALIAVSRHFELAKEEILKRINQ